MDSSILGTMHAWMDTSVRGWHGWMDGYMHRWMHHVIGITWDGWIHACLDGWIT